ncbi:MAG: Stp1/IreP family PP2C-type Ser/Thr phosphatase [Thermoanaerobaculia bacterium]
MSEQAAARSAVTTGRLIVKAVLRTDVGLVRSENQDFGTLTTPQEERSSHAGGRLLIVADGMGGHRGGATASRLAAETVKTQYLQSRADDVPAALREALARANARIFAEAQSNSDLRGMGTTTSALAVRGSRAWFAHVGDSRIYMIRNDEIRQITDDHSLVASMVREGLLTAKEAETHPRRNVLQRSMGVSEDVEIDVRGPIEVKEGDTFILCSDGLHGLVREPELKEVAKLPIDEAADEFVKRALERGAPDNVTVIVARVEKSPDLDDTVIETLSDEAVPLENAFDDTVREGEVAHPGPPPVHPAPPFDNVDELGSTFEPAPRSEHIPSFDPKASTMKVPALVLPADKVPTAPTKAFDPSQARTTEAPVSTPAHVAKTAEVPAQIVAAARKDSAPPRASTSVPTTEMPLPGMSQKPVTPAAPATQPQAATRSERASSALWWILTFLVILIVAGVWFYWNR